MKRVLFSMVLLLAASFTFAQVKNVKEAKNIANEVKPDFAKAEQLINAALTNAETKDDAATWDVAGFIQKRKSEKQMENAYLKRPYDTLQVYNSILSMCKYYLKCDELAQIPNEKGKIKNKFRKPNVLSIKAEIGNLINGGIQYYNMSFNDESKAQEYNQKSLDFFATYIDVAAHPMFEAEKLLEEKQAIAEIAYFACIAALSINDNASIAKYAGYAKGDEKYGKFAQEFICTALKAQGDTAKWVASLQEGVETYPDYPFFFGNLIDYYSSNNKYEEAMQYADNMLAKDAKNALYLYVKGYLYNNMYTNYKNDGKEQEAADALNKGIEFYQKAIEVDPNYAEAHSNLGLIYCLQAQDFSEKATTDINDSKYLEEQKILKSFYEKAKPAYEKARELKPDQKSLWMQGLYRVYYNLNMAKELEEIEQLMNL